MKDFSPKSRAQDEREIVRIQKDFSSGMFMDIPATNIPDNGVAYLKNITNKGNELVGRSGSRKWGNYATGTPHAPLPSFATGITATSTSTGTVRTITTTGYTFTSSNIGDFFVHDNGIHEIITNVTSASIIVTQTSSADSYSSSAAWLHHQLNGQYFHKYLKKIIIQLGSDLYISDDISISSWSIAYCQSTEKLANEISSFEEHGNYVLVYNRNGIYRLDLGDNPSFKCYYYKINSLVPQSQLTKPTVPELAAHCRRYIYGLGKISGIGQNRDRQTDGVVQLVDSGTNIRNSSNIDYSEYWTVDSISSGHGVTVSGFDVPVVDGSLKENHWDVYTVWGTIDTEADTTDPEAYVWIADIPVMKSFVVDVTSSTCTVKSGYISSYDIGSTVKIFNGSSIETKTITAVNTDTNTFTINTALSVNVSDSYCFIGATKGSIVSISGNTLTIVSGSNINDLDEGKRLFLSDGTTVYIDSVINGVATIPEVRITTGTTAACWDVVTRSFHDETPDSVLMSRMSGYPCYQRYYENLPNSNIGVVTAGFNFVATRNDNKIYYSELSEDFDFLAGYYHPLYQMCNVKDGIRLLKSIPDGLVIYCYGSTALIKTNTYSSVDLSNLGVSIATVTNQTTVDENIGCVAYGSVQSLEDGRHILITNEPGIRVFDGVKYSDNLASQRVVEELKRLQPNVSSVYHPMVGYIFWGLNE